MHEQGQDGLDAARGTCLGVLISLVIALVVIAAIVGLCTRGCGKAEAATVHNELALVKARLIVGECYPDSGFYPWAGTLIAEHERYAAQQGAPDFAAAWFDSLTYGAANFALRVGAVAPGNCAGPFDVKHRPLILEPRENIRWHVAEMWQGWQRGYRGRSLCSFVYLPAAPRDWGGGRFAKTEARHRAVIAKAYREGRLP